MKFMQHWETDWQSDLMNPPTTVIFKMKTKNRYSRMVATQKNLQIRS